MDFKVEEEKLLLKIMDLRTSAAHTANKQEKLMIKVKISMLTGVSLWLMSNSSNINSLSDFRDRLDSLSRVLNHPNYKLMNDNLCISCSINGFLDQDILSEELMDVLGVEELPSDLELLEISKSKYEQAGNSYVELKSTPEFLDYVSLCGHTMNFQFDGGYKNAEEEFVTVNSFYGVSDELEKIFQQKKVSGKEQRKHKGIPKK